MKKVLLSNKIRLLMQPRGYARSMTVAVYIGAGSRFEPEAQAGYSHFLEHMVFKGTQNRSAVDIANETDMLGGQLNAFTTKEYTCFYIRVLPEYAEAGIELLADIITSPLLSQKDVDTERGVILEEINMYNDDPEDLAADKIYEAAWGKDPLGRSITGTRESVSEAHADDLRGFYSEFYKPENIVIAVSGSFDSDKTAYIAEKHFSGMKSGTFICKKPQKPVYYGKNVINIKKSSQQLQFCLAFPCNGAEGRRGAQYTMLNAIAGGGASSLLFQRLREELGMAYSIYSYFTLHKGTGVFVISGGISPKSKSGALSEIEAICEALKKEIQPQQLLRAKNQVRSGLAMGYENSYNIAMDIGRRELLGLAQRSEKQNMARIAAVTEEEVEKAASSILKKDMMTACFVGALK